MNPKDTPYSLSALRALALHTQGLTTPLGTDEPPAEEAIFEIVKRLGSIQIDTLQMVQRSHYLVLWSRLGKYFPAEFDRLAYNPAQRRIFEGWQHAACYIPLDEHRYQRPLMRRLRAQPGEHFRHWLAEPGNEAVFHAVLDRIRSEGALRAADFEYNGPKRGSWWDWKPAKTALEHHFAIGDLMISERVNFQRVYDLTERVLPAWVDTCEPTTEERDRRWIDDAARSLGVCEPL